MLHRSLTLAALAAALLPAHALDIGDLSFTAFNADEDGFAMVALVDLAAGTQVYFSDNEWTGAAFNGGESYLSWNAGPGSIAAGTVVRFSSTDSSTALAASVGTLARQAVSGSSNYGFSQSEETLYAYLGSSATAPTQFLAAISTSTFESAAGGSLAGTGLAVGAGAVQLSFGSDYAQYSGVRSGAASFAAYKPLLGDVANWTDAGDGAFAGAVPDTSAFAVTAVPEPGTTALLLAGLAVVGGAARRRLG